MLLYNEKTFSNRTHSLKIEKDVTYQNLMLSYSCPKCNEGGWISNILHVGEKYTCKKCHTDLLDITKPTTIMQESSDWI